MQYKFPLATDTWDHKEYDAIQDVIRSGYFTMSNKVSDFEKQFAQYFGSRYSIMVNSGSSANLLMIAALRYTKNSNINLKKGDEIIVPAVSWPTTYYPLAQYDLKMKFVDIDIETLNYDLQALKAAISDNTRAIMVVNLLGNPNNFDEILSLAEAHNLVILEDNCESMGAKFNGRYTGTFGILGTFSCFFSHHISTMEGGIILTDDEELYHILLALRAHGWTRNLPKKNLLTGIKSEKEFEESFNFILPGYNLRPLELSGAVGIEQLKKLPDIIDGRRKNAAEFVRRFKDHQQFFIQKECGYSSWFGFSMVLEDNKNLTRDNLVQRLTELGFECRPIVAGNFANKPVMSQFKFEIHGELRNAEYIDKNGIFIGNHHYPMTSAFDALSSI